MVNPGMHTGGWNSRSVIARTGDRPQPDVKEPFVLALSAAARRGPEYQGSVTGPRVGDAAWSGGGSTSLTVG